MTVSWKKALGISTLSLFAIIALCSCAPKQAPETREPLKNPVVGYVKVATPKVLVARLLAMATQLDSSGQVGVMAPAMLAQFGYPEFDGVDATVPVTAFILHDPSTQLGGFVVALSASESSAMVQQLKKLPGMVVKSSGKWVFATKEASMLDLVKDELELIQMASEATDKDIEVVGLAEGLKNARGMILSMAQDSLVNSPLFSEEHKALVEPILIAVLDEIDTAKTAGMGLRFDVDSLRISLALDALARTPLGDFLSQKVAGNVTGGDFIAQSAPISYVADFDSKAYAAYCEHLWTLVRKVAPADMVPLLDESNGILSALLEKLDGKMGFSMDLEGMKMRQQQHLSGDLNEQLVVEIFDQVYNKMLPKVFPAEIMSSSFKANVGEVDGISYHQIDFSLPQSQGGANLEGFSSSTTEFVAVVNGDLVIGSSIELLGSVVSAVKSGKPVPGNIAELFESRKGSVLQGQIDLVTYYLNIFRGISQVSGDSSMEAFIAVLEALKKSNLEPCLIETTIGNQKAETTFSIPTSTLKAIVDSIMELRSGNAAG
jgi:hypothetical protein